MSSASPSRRRQRWPLQPIREPGARVTIPVDEEDSDSAPTPVVKLDSSRLVDERDVKRFECIICSCVVSKACGFPSASDKDGCGHMFCADCVSATKKDENGVSTCTVCRHGLPAADVSNTIDGILAQTLIKCDTPGCADEYELLMQFRGIAQHLAKCGYIKVKCPNAHCDHGEMDRKDLAQHGEVCNAREVKCDVCLEMVRFSDYDAHVNSDNGDGACNGLATCPNKCTQEDNNFIAPSHKRQVGHDHAVVVVIDSPPFWFTKSSAAAHAKICPLQSVQCSQCEESYLFKDAQRHAASSVVKHMEYMSRQIQILTSAQSRGCVLGVPFPNSATRNILEFHEDLGRLNWKRRVVFEAIGERPRIVISFRRSQGQGGNSFAGAWLSVDFRVQYSDHDDANEITEHTYAVRVFTAEIMPNTGGRVHDLTKTRHFDIHVHQSLRGNKQRSWNSLALEHFVPSPLITDTCKRFNLGVELLW